MKCIAYSLQDGVVAVVHPSPWARLVAAITVDGELIALECATPFDALVRAYKTDALNPKWAETEAQFVSRIAAKDVPAGRPFIVIDTDSLPPRETRANWRIVGDAVLAT